MVKHEIKVVDVIEDKPPEINNEQIDEEPTKEEPTKEEPTKEEEPTAKPIKEKKPRAKREKKEAIPEPKPEPIPAASSLAGMQPEPTPEPEPEPLPIEEVLPKKEQKILELVECDKCNRKMTAKTLKYSHEAICPATNPPKEKVKKPKKEEATQPPPSTEIVEVPSMPLLRRQLAMKGVNVRQTKMNHKQEMFKHMLVNAFHLSQVRIYNGASNI